MNRFVLLLLLAPVVLFSQDKQQFSLSEAVSFSQQNAYAVKDADNNISIAKQKVWETTTMGLPQLNAKVDYKNFIKQPVQLIPAELFGGAPGHFAEMTFGTKQDVNASATLTQLIFNGTYLVGIQSSKVYMQISENMKEKTEMMLKQAVTNAYAGVLMTDEGIHILEKNKKTLEKSIYDTREIYNNGFAEEQDVEQLELTLSGINNELINLRNLKQYNTKMLQYIMGIDITQPIVLTDSLESILMRHQDLNLTQEQFDFHKHIDFKIAENTIKANTLLVKYEKSQALPSLVGFINYGLTAYNDEFKFHKSEQKWLDSSVFGVSLSIPVFSSLARHSRVQQAKINLDKAERKQEETAQKLSLEYQTTWIAYKNALNTYTTSKSALALAERIEKKENIKFFEGVSSSFALSSAQTQLFKQQQLYLQAIFELITTKVALEMALNK